MKKKKLIYLILAAINLLLAVSFLILKLAYKNPPAALFWTFRRIPIDVILAIIATAFFIIYVRSDKTKKEKSDNSQEDMPDNPKKSKPNYSCVSGGVLFIVAGAFSFMANLLIKRTAEFLNAYFDWRGMIVAGFLILAGVIACSGKRKKNDLITFGILGLIFCILQITGLYSFWGLGSVQLVLISIGSLLFFFQSKIKV